jgi:rhodanese-related sulfurtransferase
VAGGGVVVDVRTPREYEELGHVPGALLLPIELVASAPAVLPEDGRAVVVVCEHGLRSRRAAASLAEAGIPSVFNMTGGMSRWAGPREHGPAPLAGPSPWLLANVPLAPRGARTLDVACGRGRHALLLAGAGFAVRAVDRDGARIEALQTLGRRLRLPLDADVVDLERADVDLGDGAWDLVLVFNFLHRPLFPALTRALAPGGLLLYETFTSGPRAPGREQAPLSTGRTGQAPPTSPDHLLEPGELERLVAPLEVVRRGARDLDGRPVASVAARKPSVGGRHGAGPYRARHGRGDEGPGSQAGRRSVASPPRTTSASHRAETTKTARTPATQTRPAARHAAPSRRPGARTPGARKR